MKDLWNNTVLGLKAYKLAWIKVFLASTITSATAFQTSMIGIEWPALTGTQKFLVICGVYIVGAGTILSFLDKSLSRIEQQKKDDENTKIFVSANQPPKP